MHKHLARSTLAPTFTNGSALRTRRGIEGSHDRRLHDVKSSATAGIGRGVDAPVACEAAPKPRCAGCALDAATRCRRQLGAPAAAAAKPSSAECESPSRSYSNSSSPCFCHELEQTLDFGEIHAANRCTRVCLAVSSFLGHLEFEKFPWSALSSPQRRCAVTTTSSSIRMPPTPSM